MGCGYFEEKNNVLFQIGHDHSPCFLLSKEQKMTKRFVKNQISRLQKRICARREESPPNQILALDALFQYYHPHTKLSFLRKLKKAKSVK